MRARARNQREQAGRCTGQAAHGVPLASYLRGRSSAAVQLTSAFVLNTDNIPSTTPNRQTSSSSQENEDLIANGSDIYNASLDVPLWPYCRWLAASALTKRYLYPTQRWSIFTHVLRCRDIIWPGFCMVHDSEPIPFVPWSFHKLKFWTVNLVNRIILKLYILFVFNSW